MAHYPPLEKKVDPFWPVFILFLSLIIFGCGVPDPSAGVSGRKIGGSSNPSGRLTENLPAPSNLLVESVNIQRLDVFWQDNSNEEEGFVLERRTLDGDFEEVQSLPADTEYYADMGLQEGQEYFYRIKAKGTAVESSYSLAMSAIPSEAGRNIPIAPSELRLTVLNTSKIQLAWKDNSDNETAFLIQRKEAGDSNFSIIEVLGEDATAFTNDNLEANTRYTYRVQAINDDEVSTFCSEKSATTQGGGRETELD